MKRIAAVVCADDPASPVLSEILAGLEEEGVPGEVMSIGEAFTKSGDAASAGAGPIELAKSASRESVFGCGIGLGGGEAALFAGGAVIMAPGDASPRIAGKNAALYIKRERFELA